ncbi:segregation and condensation protein A [Bifidobacterium aemilianum]|nr:ScpA family protein [Bifidobacterium aemilianum]
MPEEAVELQGVTGDRSGHGTGFSVDLEVYSGPFDALLSMIANKRLDLTELSLSAITEEFLAYVRGLDLASNMEEASSFLDVASILVEAKSAALLPGDAEGQRDEQSMEALRERDLLFARLLQYRAFKEVAADFQLRLAENSGRFAHPAYLDPQAAASLPELEWTLTPQQLALLAAQVFANAPASEVAISQLHVPLVDLQAQSDYVRDELRGLASGHSMTFDQLTENAGSSLEVVARFLAILIFFKQGLVQFKQTGPFEALHLRWVKEAETGAAGGHVTVSQGDFA